MIHIPWFMVACRILGGRGREGGREREREGERERERREREREGGNRTFA